MTLPPPRPFRLVRFSGGIMLTPLPGATPTKPGACMQPFFGIQVSLRNPMDGTVITGPGEVGLPAHIVLRPRASWVVAKPRLA